MRILALGNPLVSCGACAVGRGAAAAWVAWSLAAMPLVGLAADGPTAGRARARVSDPAVVPAGGMACPSCGPGGCRTAHGKHQGHHAGCRDGVCVPYCPVRPQQFGFYGTQWRRWPGSDVVPVSGMRDAGPVAPPRSAVPGPNEESMNPEAGQETAADPGVSPGAAPTPLATPRELPPEPLSRLQPTVEPPAPKVLEPEAEMQPEPPAKLQPEPVPDAKPVPVPEPEPVPESKPVLEPNPVPKLEPKPVPADPSAPAPGLKPRPEDENLFEAVSGVVPGWRAQRRFAVGAAATRVSTLSDTGRVEPASHLEGADPNRVPRVSFDPAAETRRLRSIR